MGNKVKVINDFDITSFENQVEKYLNDGYVFHGSMMNISNKWIQVMVKYDTEYNEPPLPDYDTVAPAPVFISDQRSW